MKKLFWSGLGIGVLLSVLIGGISVAALTNGRDITVEDGVKVTINGTLLSPKDAQGRAVSVFSYNDTVYAPIRAISEALGCDVSYDPATRIAAVKEAASPAIPNDPARDGTASSALSDDPTQIGRDRAKELALQHAGVSADQANLVTAKLDRENGRVVYDVEFYTKSTEYDYAIDALTGEIVAYDHDAEDYAPPAPVPQINNYIGEVKAKEIALAKAPKATVVKCVLEEDDGQVKYELELREGSIEYDCDIDAVSGAVLIWEKDLRD